MKKTYYFLIFLVFSLTTIDFWFKEHAILFLGDEPFIYDPKAYLLRRSFSWLEISGGYLSTPVSAYYISLWYYTLASLGLSAWLIQAVTFFLLLFLQFCSVFILSSFILKSKFPKETSRIYVCSFFGSLVYVFNTYQMTSIWIDLKGLAYSAAFYPVFLYSIFRILSDDKNINSNGSKLKYALIGAISLFFTIWGTPKIWIPLVIYTIGFAVWGLVYFNNWKGKKSFIVTLKRACNRYLIIMLIVSSLLLIPEILTIFLSLTSLSPSYTLPRNIETYIHILKIRSKDTTLINTFHFWGMNMLNEPVASNNKMLKDMISFLGMPINQFVLFIPTILIFSSLILEKRLIRKFVLLYILLLITITAISIIHIPLLRDLYLHIYRTTRILTVFNEPWSNFGLFYILLVSLLITVSLFLFIRTSRSVKSYLLILLLLLYLIPTGYLFVTGKFIPQEGLYNSKVKVPDYVLEDLKFVESRNSQSKNRVLILPYFKGKEASNWEWSYWGNSILVWLTKDDVIGSGYYAKHNIPLRLLSEIQNKDDLYYYIAKKYNLRLPPLNIKTLIKNPSFEEVYTKKPEHWKLHNAKDFKISLDSDSYTGKYSLKVYTSTTKQHTWSWIRSDPVNVKPGEKYLIITHMKYYNVKGSHIKIEIYYPNENKWGDLTPFIPPGRIGTSNWQVYSAIIKIPENVTKMRIVLNAGWVLNKNDGDAITWFDDVLVLYSMDEYIKALLKNETYISKMNSFYINLLRILGVKWVIIREDIRWTPLMSRSEPNVSFIEHILSSHTKYLSKFDKIEVLEALDALPPVYVAEQVVVINVSNVGKFIDVLSELKFNETSVAILDNSFCYDIDKDILKFHRINITNYRILKVNPTLYKIYIYKSEGPVLIVLLQNYDKYWNAYVVEDGKNIKIPENHHFIINGYANGWYINKTGTFKIELRYEPQKYYGTGIIISKLMFTVCIGYFFYDWRREKGDKWAKEIERRLNEIKRH